jgi:type IV secretion system protein VirB6
MYSWVGNQFDVVLAGYVFSVVASLAASLAPVALSAMTLWVTLYGWAVLRNEVPETVQSFVWKAFKIGLVLAIALQAGVYVPQVADTANSLATGVAVTFLPASIDPTTITNPYQLLDHFTDEASRQASDLLKEATLFRLDLLLAACLFSTGSVIFLCIAMFVVTLSKVLLAFVIAVGPVFVLCLAWRPTQRFFDSWLSMVLNAVVLTWFAFFALGISTFLGNQVFLAIDRGGGFLGGTFNVLGECLRYCVLMILLAILCFQAPGLAAALTGGAAVQQGVQMVQNTLMVAGMRSAGRAGTTPPGGVMRAGMGLPHAAGFATGRAAMAAGQAVAGTGVLAVSAARQVGSGVRTAAYKLAALRGRA